MKTLSIPFHRVLGSAITMACVLSLPLMSQAKDDKDKRGHGNDSKHKSSGNSNARQATGARLPFLNTPRSHESDRARQAYSSFSRSGFTLSLGNGYAGRGYYYGPPNSPYYYQRPEVRYYATREAAPREYYSRGGYPSNNTEAAVQQALAQAGYYQGSIDGQIGPQSRRAISRYQQDRGLPVSGSITQSLLRSLGLQ
jgi:hypothetical protein